MKLEPIIEIPCMTTGLWRRFAIHLFEGKLTLENMEHLEKASEGWHAKIKGKLVEMVVIYPSKAHMTSDERARMTRIIKRWEHARAASATVILAEGILGSLQRSVLTGLQMVVPAPHPTKVFGATPDAVRWLGPHIEEVCGPEAREKDLVAAIETLADGFMKREVRAPMELA
jgi:hypothetical protein